MAFNAVIIDNDLWLGNTRDMVCIPGQPSMRGGSATLPSNSRRHIIHRQQTILTRAVHWHTHTHTQCLCNRGRNLDFFWRHHLKILGARSEIWDPRWAARQISISTSWLLNTYTKNTITSTAWLDKYFEKSLAQGLVLFRFSIALISFH
jgi:hypothetical protein